MRSYWKIQLKHGRSQFHYWFDYVYVWTDRPLGSNMIPREAVRQGMMLDVFLHSVDKVRMITKEEYLMHMWE